MKFSRLSYSRPRVYVMLEKESLYKTAFSPMFEVYVRISRAYKDSAGEWIFMCSSEYDPNAILEDHLFRKYELRNFCL